MCNSAGSRPAPVGKSFAKSTRRRAASKSRYTTHTAKAATNEAASSERHMYLGDLSPTAAVNSAVRESMTQRSTTEKRSSASETSESENSTSGSTGDDGRRGARAEDLTRERSGVRTKLSGTETRPETIDYAVVGHVRPVGNSTRSRSRTISASEIITRPLVAGCDVAQSV